MAIKIQACKDVLDDFARITVPNVVLRSLPLRMASCYREGPLVFKVIMLPLNIAKVDCVDLSIKINVVRNGGESLWGTSVAAHSSRMWLIFLCESSASVKRKSASSKPAREVKGVQSSSAFRVGNSGGVFGGTNMPFLSQRRPANRG